MTRIKQNDIIPPPLMVQAAAWHRERGNQRIRVARTYHVLRTRDESSPEEYVLTRYETNRGAAMSMLLKVEGEGWDLKFTEVSRDERREEGRMLRSWYDKNGAIRDGL